MEHGTGPSILGAGTWQRNVVSGINDVCVQNYTELYLPLLLTAPMLLAFAAYWKREK
jgi:hypothetical protein